MGTETMGNRRCASVGERGKENEKESWNKKIIIKRDRTGGESKMGQHSD